MCIRYFFIIYALHNNEKKNQLFCITGIRLLTGGGQLYTYDSRDARALSFNRGYIDIYSSSWSPAGSNVVEGPDEAAARAIHEGVTKVNMICS